MKRIYSKKIEAEHDYGWPGNHMYPGTAQLMIDLDDDLSPQASNYLYEELNAITSAEVTYIPYYTDRYGDVGGGEVEDIKIIVKAGDPMTDVTQQVPIEIYDELYEMAEKKAQSKVEETLIDGPMKPEDLIG